MKKSIIIWTEGGTRIGMWHFRRSLILAHQLRKDGINILFIINKKQTLIKLLESDSFPYYISPISNIKYPELIDKVASIDYVIIDTKKPVASAIQQLHRNGHRVVLMDNDTEANIKSDIVVYSTPILSESNRKLVSLNGRVFGGADYVLISEHFYKYRKSDKDLTYKMPLKVLVTIGGSDPKGLTYKVVSALLESDIPTVVQVIIGLEFAKNRLLKEIEDEKHPNVSFLRNIEDLPEIMSNSHIAITDFSNITIFELAYLGVPSIVIANYKSDKRNMNALENLKISIPLGYYKDITNKAITTGVSMIQNDRELWCTMSRNGKALIDGNGAKRIALLMNLDLRN